MQKPAKPIPTTRNRQHTKPKIFLNYMLILTNIDIYSKSWQVAESIDLLILLHIPFSLCSFTTFFEEIKIPSQISGVKKWKKFGEEKKCSKFETRRRRKLPSKWGIKLQDTFSPINLQLRVSMELLSWTDIEKNPKKIVMDCLKWTEIEKSLSQHFESFMTFLYGSIV